MLGKRKRKKKVWKLFNLRRGPGEYLLANMEEKDFDKAVTGKDYIVIECNGVQIFFLATPVIPVVIYRGLKHHKKLPFGSGI